MYFERMFASESNRDANGARRPIGSARREGKR
jgi:hypothetical protein